MKVTKRQLRRIIREALTDNASMADNKAKIDMYLEEIAAEIQKDPANAGNLLKTFQPAAELDMHQQSMEGALRIDDFLDMVQERLQDLGVDRRAAIQFTDSFLKFR